MPNANQSTCPERTGANKEHCWHTSSAPMRNPDSVVFQSVCCFCAPAWIHFQVFVPANVPDEEIEATQIAHGHLITMNRIPRQGPKLTVLGR